MSGIIAQNTLDSSGLIKAPAGGGAWTVIKKITASSDSTLEMVHGTSDVTFDSTYPVYSIKCINIHPSSNTDDIKFSINFTIDGTNYNVAKTTTSFDAYADEADSSAALRYLATKDLAQGTGAQNLSYSVGGENDESCSGEILIFAPSSTTYAKHFIANFNFYNSGDYSVHDINAGYCNTTSALTGFQFKFSSGNIDAGDIVLMGLSSS